MTGKSTAATLLASSLKYASLSTDDIGAAVAAVTDKSTHPAFHYMISRDYRDYYATADIQKLMSDIDAQHAALWPALRVIFQNHASWGRPIVIEGWALRPENVSKLSGDIDGVFLIADESLIQKRVRNSDFSMGARDRETMLRNYLERSLRYNAEIRKQARRLGLSTIHLSDEMKPWEIVEKCIRILQKARL